MLLALALALTLACCSAQELDGASVGVDDSGQLVFTNGDATVTLGALVAQLSALSAANAALRAEVCLNGALKPFQSVATIGAIDWEAFSVDGQSYLAVASQSNGNISSLNSSILRFDGSAFVPFQSVPTQGGYDFEFFSINGQSYLAVANMYAEGPIYSINSQILRFDRDSTRFVHLQWVPTQGAVDFEFFSIRNQSYLAIANYRRSRDLSDFSTTSQILRFNGSSFVHFQWVATHGAYDWEFFTIRNESYLAVANFYNGSHRALDSQIMRFNGSGFVPFQAVPTVGAQDWEYFTIGSDSYLAVANSFNGTVSSSPVDSHIFRFDGTRFVVFQAIPATRALDWQFFTVGQHSYLAMANFRSGLTDFSIDSPIFRFNGTGFAPFLTVPTTGAAVWEYFSVGDQSYLAVAHHVNDEGTTRVSANSQIYRIVRPCF
jgi:hypothetical protein